MSLYIAPKPWGFYLEDIESLARLELPFGCRYCGPNPAAAQAAETFRLTAPPAIGPFLSPLVNVRKRMVCDPCLLLEDDLKATMVYRTSSTAARAAILEDFARDRQDKGESLRAHRQYFVMAANADRQARLRAVRLKRALDSRRDRLQRASAAQPSPI